MKQATKLSNLAILIPFVFLFSIISINSAAQRRLAVVEDRSITVDSIAPNSSNSANNEEFLPTPDHNKNFTEINSLSNVNIQPVPAYEPNISTNSVTAKRKNFSPADINADINQEFSDNNNNTNLDEIRALEQEIEADGDSDANDVGFQRRMKELQSLSSTTRIQRLENIIAQQQKLKLDKKIKLLQLQLQNMNGLLETQQYAFNKSLAQQKLLLENFEAKLASAKTADPIPVPSVSPAAAAAAIIATNVSNKDKHPGGFEISSNAKPKPNAAPTPTSSVKPASAIESKIAAKKSFTYQDKDVEQQNLFNSAYDNIKARKYDQAVELFNQYKKKYPDGQFGESANYWLGEIYMLQSKYDKALAAFDSVLTKYPKGQKAPDAMYKKGLVYLYLKDFKQSKKVLASVKKAYSNTPAAGLAEKQLKTIESL
jgi:tol-pal system protein YbgF